MRPPNANILDKFVKDVGGHLTYALRDKKPKTLAEAKEITIEVEQNPRISKVDVDEHPRAKVKVKKGKSKDQHEETLLVLLKEMEKLYEEMNSQDRLYMSKFTTLERAQKSCYIPKGKPFPRKQNEEVKPNSSQVPNTLAPTNAVAQDSSSNDEQSDEDGTNDEEVNEQANLVEFEAFNILLRGSYAHPSIVRSLLKRKSKSQSLTLIIVEDSKGSNIHEKTTTKTLQPTRKPTKMTLFPRRSLTKNLSLKIRLKRILRRKPIPIRKRPSKGIKVKRWNLISIWTLPQGR